MNMKRFENLFQGQESEVLEKLIHFCEEQYKGINMLSETEKGLSPQIKVHNYVQKANLNLLPLEKAKGLIKMDVCRLSAMDGRRLGTSIVGQKKFLNSNSQICYVWQEFREYMFLACERAKTAKQLKNYYEIFIAYIA
jgi:hypothetical protein